MGSLGMPEILMILVIALIVFGPRKLPELGKTLGQSLAQFRRASEDFKRQWEDEVAIERQRIEAPAPAAMAPESYSAAAAPAGEELQTSPSEEPSPEQLSPEQLSQEEPSQVPTSTEAQAAAAHHEETVARETKHDWM